MIVDFPTRNTLLMLLYEFPVESLRVILANRLSTLIAFWEKLLIISKFLPGKLIRNETF